MREDIKACVSARETFFENYYSVPVELAPEVETFISELYKLGESCDSVTAFEDAFVKTGLSDKFNSILPRCTPKPIDMTAKQKQFSMQTAKELYKENGGNLLKDIASDVADTASVELQEKAIAMNREAMVEAGVFDDYTRASNVVEDAGLLFGFLKKKFGKKKEK